MAGLVTGLAAAILWILAVFVLPLALPYVISRFTGAGGVAAATIDSNSILLAAAIGFILGFVWKYRRLRITS